MTRDLYPPPLAGCAQTTLSMKNCCNSPKSVVFKLYRPVPAPHFGSTLFSANVFNLTYAAPALREVHCSTLHRRSCGIWFTYSYPWLSSIILSGIHRATALAGVWCLSSVYEKARFYMKTYRRGRLQVHARALKFPHDPWFVSPPSRRVCTPNLVAQKLLHQPQVCCFRTVQARPSASFRL